jgi:hypothetical protein
MGCQLAEERSDGRHDCLGIIFALEGAFPHQRIREGHSLYMLEALRHEVQHSALDE